MLTTRFDPDDGSTFKKDLQALQIGFTADIQHPLYYVSGPKPMVVAIEQTLTNIGVPRENIVHDYFPGYEGI